MNIAFLKDAHPISKFFFLLFAVLVSALVFVILGVILAIPIFDINIITNPAVFTNFSNPLYLQVLKFFQLVQSIGLFLVPPILVGFFFCGNPVKYLSLNKIPNGLIAVMAGLTMFAAIPLINVLAELNSKMSFPDFLHSMESWMKDSELKAAQITEAFLNVKNVSGLLFNIILIGVVPALGEELLFRGVLQKLFHQWYKNKHVAIFISAFLFSAIHLQFYGFIPRFLMGLFFGYLLIWSGTIWVPIIAHFVNNTMAVIFMYLANNQKIDFNIDKIGSKEGSIMYAIISFLAVTGFIIGIYLIRKKSPTDSAMLQN